MARRSAFRLPGVLLLVGAAWLAVTGPVSASDTRAPAASASAATPAGPPSPPASDETLRQRFESVQAATVGVRVRAVDGASSVRTLGREREGTGVVIAPQGLVLTIGYLIVEAEQVQVITRDQARVPAQVVAYDAVTGLGLLRPLFPLPGVQQVKLGSAFAAERGLPLLAMTGSAPRQTTLVRLVDIRPFTGYWEYHLDAALYTAPAFGNHSGAGLFNAQGELVGIANLLLRDVRTPDDPDAEPGNLFVPVDVLLPVIDELVRTGNHPQSQRPWLGINAMELEGRIRIVRVTPDSPAQEAGLRAGDWVVAVDGEDVRTLEAFYKRLWAHGVDKGGLSVTIRDGAAGTRVLDVPVRVRTEVMAKPKGI
jgi:S1-C subfamily serine protease